MCRRFNKITSVIALLLLPACAVGPKYKKPGSSSPMAYKSYGKTKWVQSDPKDDRIHGNWWGIYKDSKLDALEQQVNVSNQNIAVAFAQFLQARAAIKIARSQYYPTLNLDPNLSKQGGHVSATTNSGNFATSGTYTQYNIPFDASWVPDLFGRVQSTVAQASANAQLSAALLENQRLVQQADLAIAYYQLRGQDALKDLLDASVAAYSESLALTRSRYKTGIDSDEAVAQAETQLKTTQALATNVGLSRAQYEHAIALLTGQAASDFSLAHSPLTEVTAPHIPMGVPSTLLERRPDIAAAERNMAAMNAQIGVGVSAFYPSVTLSGSAGVGGYSYTTLFGVPTFIWSLGVGLTQSIFDGGLRSATLQQYKAVYDQAVASYRQTVLAAFQQTEDGLAGVSILSKQISEQELAVAASARFLKIATARYKTGIDPYLNVLTAQISLLGNQQTLISLKTQLMVSSVQLVEALGGGWESSTLPSQKLILEDAPKAASAGRQ